MFVKGVPSCCQCNYSHTVKMRYQNEIEEILRISEEFGSKIKNKYIVLQAIYREQNWKNNDLASLGHKLASMSTLFKFRNEIAWFIQDLERKIRIWVQNSVKEQFLSIPYGLKYKKQYCLMLKNQ